MPKDYDFGAAFARIEEELIGSMMRNLQRYHLDWEDAEGFDWTQWQVEQLQYLEEYRRANQERFGPRFSSINTRIEEAIRHGYENGQKAEELNILEALANNRSLAQRLSAGTIGNSFFRINDRKLEALLRATSGDMLRAEQAVLRRANDQYRKIIFSAQMYANTGAGTVQKAVDMATKDFLMRGIDCIEYKNGARHTISDYADMAIRTAERRAYLWGEGQKRQEWGVSLVIVNKRGGHPCPHCAKWVGKILIDDVYSGGKPDGKHTLLSEAMAQGFLHPLCKDGFTTYFPGITSVPDKPSREELREAEAAEAEEAKQQNAERMAEKWDRRAQHSLDPGDKRAAEARAAEWREEAEQLAKKDSSDIQYEMTRLSPEKQKDVRDTLDRLNSEYESGLRSVVDDARSFGPEGVRSRFEYGDGSMHLEATGDLEIVAHEFGHSIASKKAEKMGVASYDPQFWKEMRKLHKEYKEQIHRFGNRQFALDEMGYADDIDEFIAEAFSAAKFPELGANALIEDRTYADRALEIIDRYFRKEPRAMGLPKAFDDSFGERITWPKAGKKITTQEFKEVREYAQTKGITLRGVKGSDVDLDLLRNAVDKTSEIISKYDLQAKLGEPFTLDFSHALYSADFAVTYPGTKHLIYFNRDAFRSAEALAEAYMEGGRFVPGATYKSIPYHEMGHLIADIFDINPLPIAKRISGETTWPGLREYLKKNLSIYSADAADGSEIIAECYSAVFSGTNNEFALRFVAECDKIIATRR